MNQFSLKDKVAIVTGALGLLGLNHCEALAEAGASVIITDLDEQACQDFAAKLPTRSIGMGLDVRRKDSVKATLEKVLAEFKKVNILVNNAAINDMFETPGLAIENSKFENYPLEIWQKFLDINITGVFLCSQIIGSHMANSGGGSIINIASTYGIVAPDQSLYRDKNGKQKFYKSPAYPTTKGAILAFTRFLAAYWGNKSVRVNAISPGGIENQQDDFFVKEYAKKTPLDRMAKPTDCKGALVFLASDASDYMTGANLIVDGGWTIW